MDFIKDLLEDLSPLSDESWDKLKPHLMMQKLEKGELFVSAGEVPTKIAFIKEGVFKISYRNESNLSYIKLFSGPNELIAPFADYLRHQNSKIDIAAITKSKIYTCTFKDLEQLLKESNDWEIYRRKIVEMHYLLKEKKENELVMNDAVERYVKFNEQFNRFLDDIPDYFIADYLNISPSYLSTIKKRLKS